MRFPRLLIVAAMALAAASCSKSAKQYFENGNKYYAQQKFPEAIVEYRNAIQKDQRYADARLKLAEACESLGQSRCAYDEYVRAADLLPNNANVQLKAGWYLARAGQEQDATTRVEGVLKKEPRNVDALILKGNIAARLQDMDGAVKQMEEAIRIAPKDSRAYTNLGLLEGMKGDVRAAEQSFLQAVDADPKSITARRALANLYFQTNRRAEAEATLRAAYSIDPKDVLLNRALAVFYVLANRPAEAEPYLKNIVETTKAVDPTLELARYYAANKRVPEAIALLDKLSANKQAYARAKTQMAQLQYREGHQPEARKTIDEVLAKEPKNEAALLVKAQFLMQEKRPDEAQAAAQAAVVANPRSPEAHYLLGVIYAGKNNAEQARTEFNEVLAINPRVAAAQLQIARLELATRGAAGAPTAVQFAEQAVTNAKGSPIARLVLVRSLIAKGDPASLSRADGETKTLLQQFPNVASVHVGAGLLQARKKDYAGARKSFERALQLNPNDREAVAALVNLDVVGGKPAEARRRVEERLAAAPNDPGVLLLAGMTYLQTGDAARAEQLLLKTIEVAPASLQAYGLLGRLYLQQRKLDEARQKFEEIARRQAKPVGAQTMVAMILQLQGKQAEAQKRYEKVLEIDRNAPVAANNLAWMYAEGAGSIDSALQLAQVAKAGLPDIPQVNDTLGWIYVKKDMAGLAIAPLQQAVDKDPTNPVYHYHLGVAYAKRNNQPSAKRSLETALKLSPDFDGAADARKMLESVK